LIVHLGDVELRNVLLLLRVHAIIWLNAFLLRDFLH
jgi:hypothetical protein